MNLISKINQLIGEYCYHELQECELRNKQELFNQRCHLNSVDFALKHKGFDVVMGLQKYKGGSGFHLHFWVRKGAIDYEVTAGHQCTNCRYWELKIIEPSDYHQIEGVFSDALTYYKLQFTTPWQRFWLTNKRVI